jgi:hypothetical protein
VDAALLVDKDKQAAAATVIGVGPERDARARSYELAGGCFSMSKEK